MRYLFALLSLAIAAAQTPELKWIAAGPTAAEFEVNGLPWFAENKGAFIRLPLTLQKVVRPAVWNLAQSPSGGRLRFRTDATAVGIRVEYPNAPNMSNMHAFGQTGVDLYADGAYIGSAIADKDAAPGKVYEKIYFSGMPRVEREITIYLSLYKPVKVIAIGVNPEARMMRARRFALDRPIVFYGTSITQGGCASRPAMSYQAILGRMLNVDFVNLGFSGNGLGEPELAEAVASIDAACYVVDFAQNNRTAENLATAYGPFLAKLRSKRPDAPVIAITPIYKAAEATGDSENTKMREHIRQVVSRAIADGDRHLQIVEGTDLLGPGQSDGLVDGTHPNDLGFQGMANGLATRLREFLKLN